MLRTLLFVGLFIASGDNAGVEQDLKAIVDIFNTLYIDSAVYFYTDFGKELPLLHGNAEVQVSSPIQLIDSSQVRDGNTTLYKVQLKSDFIKVLIPPGSVWWTMKGCFIQVKYSVSRKSIAASAVPTSFSVTSCDLLESGHGATPENPEQILPVLSEGVYSAVAKYLTFNVDWYPSINQQLRSEIVNQFLRYVVYQLAPQEQPPELDQSSWQYLVGCM